MLTAKKGKPIATSAKANKLLQSLIAQTIHAIESRMEKTTKAIRIAKGQYIRLNDGENYAISSIKKTDKGIFIRFYETSKNIKLTPFEFDPYDLISILETIETVQSIQKNPKVN